jgi:hypothetical protein
VNSGTGATEIAGISGGLVDADLAPPDRAFTMQALGVGRIVSSADHSPHPAETTAWNGYVINDEFEEKPPGVGEHTADARKVAMAILSAHSPQDAVDASIEWAKASSGIPADSTLTSADLLNQSRTRSELYVLTLSRWGAEIPARAQPPGAAG